MMAATTLLQILSLTPNLTPNLPLGRALQVVNRARIKLSTSKASMIEFLQLLRLEWTWALTTAPFCRSMLPTASAIIGEMSISVANLNSMLTSVKFHALALPTSILHKLIRPPAAGPVRILQESLLLVLRLTS